MSVFVIITVIIITYLGVCLSLTPSHDSPVLVPKGLVAEGANTGDGCSLATGKWMWAFGHCHRRCCLCVGASVFLLTGKWKKKGYEEEEKDGMARSEGKLGCLGVRQTRGQSDMQRPIVLCRSSGTML